MNTDTILVENTSIAIGWNNESFYLFTERPIMKKGFVEFGRYKVVRFQ